MSNTEDIHVSVVKPMRRWVDDGGSIPSGGYRATAIVALPSAQTSGWAD